MRRTIMAILGFTAATWLMGAHADVRVQAVRIGAQDVVALAKFYGEALGLKEIFHYGQPGQPQSEIIMRYGATIDAAKASSSTEFVIEHREPGTVNDSMPHAILLVSDIGAAVEAVKAAGATIKDEIISTTIKATGTPVKFALFVDPDGNVIELMELPKGVDYIQPQP